MCISVPLYVRALKLTRHTQYSESCEWDRGLKLGKGINHDSGRDQGGSCGCISPPSLFTRYLPCTAPQNPQFFIFLPVYKSLCSATKHHCLLGYFSRFHLNKCNSRCRKALI